MDRCSELLLLLKCCASLKLASSKHSFAAKLKAKKYSQQAQNENLKMFSRYFTVFYHLSLMCKMLTFN